MVPCERSWLERSDRLVLFLRKRSLVLMVVVDALLFFLLSRLTTPLWHLFGADIIEYENWGGELKDPIRYKFGVGSFEFLFVAVKAIVLFDGRSGIK